MKFVANNDSDFAGFGEVYFSAIYPGVVKGWHLHSEMTINYVCVVGEIKLALYDDRPGSPSRGWVDVLFLGAANYAKVRVPPGVWNGFKGIGTTLAIVANCASIPHDPNEIRRMDPHNNTIPYDWARADG